MKKGSDFLETVVLHRGGGGCKTSTCIWIYQLSYNITYFILHYKIKWTSQRDAKADKLIISLLSERILLTRD